MLGFTDLPRPRSLTAAERDLLSALVARSGSAGLAAQLETAAVTGICTCGCPSVRLATDGPAITPAAVAALSSAGREDWASVPASAGPAEPFTDRVDVVLHVVQGTLHELEVFAGEGVAVALPSPQALRY